MEVVDRSKAARLDDSVLENGNFTTIVYEILLSSFTFFLENIAEKKTRVTKKETLFAFVKPLIVKDGDFQICACGCVKDNQHMKFAAPHTAAVQRHMEKHHLELLNEWNACKDMRGDFKLVYQKRDKLFDVSANRIKAQQAHSKSIFKKVLSGLSNQVLASLHLTIWAVCNAISRVALNDPIFDQYHKLLGILSK